jgi:hypothetical protein
MKKCEICGGLYDGNECPFKQHRELPWAEDYAQMEKGNMEHVEHQRNVARWVLHTASEHAENVLVWAKKLMFVEK